MMGGLRGWRWPALALIASLVLNGFLVGMLAADWLKPHHRFSGERFARFELRRFDDRLPPSAVDAIAAKLKPLAPALDERIAKMRSIREEIMALAAKPEPDRAAIEERLQALRAESGAAQESLQTATYDALLALPADVRAGLTGRPGKR